MANSDYAYKKVVADLINYDAYASGKYGVGKAFKYFCDGLSYSPYFRVETPQGFNVTLQQFPKSEILVSPSFRLVNACSDRGLKVPFASNITVGSFDFLHGIRLLEDKYPSTPIREPNSDLKFKWVEQFVFWSLFGKPLIEPYEGILRAG